MLVCQPIDFSDSIYVFSSEDDIDPEIYRGVVSVPISKLIRVVTIRDEEHGEDCNEDECNCPEDKTYSLEVTYIPSNLYKMIEFKNVNTLNKFFKHMKGFPR